MTATVLISIRVPEETRNQFSAYCSQEGLTVSEALRRVIARAIELKRVTPEDDIWDVIGKGQLPAGYKNRFAMLPKLTKDLPPKDYPGDEPWHIRPNNPWKPREIF